MKTMHIKEDDLTGSAIAALLDEHLADMHAITPAESVHAMDLADLRAMILRIWLISNLTNLHTMLRPPSWRLRFLMERKRSAY